MGAAQDRTRPVGWADILHGQENLLLMVEYSAPTPLWVRGACVADLTNLALPPELKIALIAWQQHFHSHFFIDRLPYWDDPSAERWHFAEGPRLRDQLVAALPDADITLHMWAAEYQPGNDKLGAD